MRHPQRRAGRGRARRVDRRRRDGLPRAERPRARRASARGRGEPGAARAPRRRGARARARPSPGTARRATFLDVLRSAAGSRPADGESAGSRGLRERHARRRPSAGWPGTASRPRWRRGLAERRPGAPARRRRRTGARRRAGSSRSAPSAAAPRSCCAGRPRRRRRGRGDRPARRRRPRPAGDQRRTPRAATRTTRSSTRTSRRAGRRGRRDARAPDVARRARRRGRAVDLLYVDGAHRYAPARADIERWGARVPAGGDAARPRLVQRDRRDARPAPLLFVSRAGATWAAAARSPSTGGRSSRPGRARGQPGAPAAGLAWFVRNCLIKVAMVARLRPRRAAARAARRRRLALLTRRYVPRPWMTGAYRELYELEDRHWWFRGRRAVIWALLRRADPPPSPRVLDAGCGTGPQPRRAGAARPG